MTTDYKTTVFLPQTSFPMRGDLPQREPELLHVISALGSASGLARRLNSGQQ